MYHTEPNPFPITVVMDGAPVTILDELCICGRKRSEHADTHSFGHGDAWPTGDNMSYCSKFIFSKLVTEGSK